MEVSFTIPYTGDEGDNDILYRHGREDQVGHFDEADSIDSNFETPVYTYEHPHYTLVGVDFDAQGANAKLSLLDNKINSDPGSSKGSFVVHLDLINFGGQDSVNIKMTLKWEPADDLIQSITAEYDKRMAEYDAEKAIRFKTAFYTAARERIKLASKILPRPAEDLREEERTVVYRKLISQLMSVGTNESKHVISELGTVDLRR